jgi:hypothetical protein
MVFTVPKNGFSVLLETFFFATQAEHSVIKIAAIIALTMPKPPKASARGRSVRAAYLK